VSIERGPDRGATRNPLPDHRSSVPPLPRSGEVSLPPGLSQYDAAAALARWLQVECGATIRGYDVSGDTLTIPADVPVQRVLFLHAALQSERVVAQSLGLCRQSQELVGKAVERRREGEEPLRNGRTLRQDVARSAARLRNRTGPGH